MRMLGSVALVVGALLYGIPAAAATLPPPTGTLDLAEGADATLTGDRDTDLTGWVVAPAGDVNGDGRPDFLVAAPKADPNGRTDAGSVYVVFGPAAGLPGKLTELGDRGFRIDGAAAGDRAGTAVAAAGDVDGDGFGDVLVGAPHVGGPEPGPVGLADVPGAAYLVHGRPGSATVELAQPSAAVTRLTTGVAADQTGVSVATAPDMNGDGRGELLVGAARADGDRGDVYVVFSDHAAGDVDLGRLGDRGFRIVGPPGAHAGLAVAGVSDMNGDGRGEIVVGAPLVRGPDGKREVGAGFVVFGRSTADGVDLNALGGQGFAVTGSAGDHYFGLSAAGLGDMTGDGVPDVAFGAPGADRNERQGSGSVYVVAGQAGPGVQAAGAPPGFHLDGAAAGDWLGMSVASAGDVNGDGIADLAASAPFADTLSRNDAGVVYVLLGSGTPGNVDGASLGTAGYRLAGPAPGALVRSFAAIGDLDGDTAGDLLVGAQGAGAVHVVLGARPAPPAAVDPGVIEEEQSGCRAADNVEMLIDDSGSMADSDPEFLRREAVELMIAKPRNTGEVLGAYEFGDSGAQLFAPQTILPRGPGSNQPELFKTLEQRLAADNGSTDYNAAFTGVANDNPAAAARIFVTDGEHNVGEYLNGHRGGPPTYVIGLNIGTEGAGRRLRRIADETKGRYFPDVTAQRIQGVIDRIDSRLNCDVALDSEVDTLTDQQPDGEQTVDLDSAAHAYDVDVMWGDDADSVVPEEVTLEGAGGRVLTQFTGPGLRRALRRPGTLFVKHGVRLRATRRSTFFALRISGAQGERLRVRYRMTHARGRSARVTSHITQSRRRR